MSQGRRHQELSATTGQPRVARNGQAIGIAHLFASLIVGAALFILFKRVITPILETADGHTTNELSQNGNIWLTDLLANIPFIFAGIAFFGLIALAVFQSRLG